MSGSELLSYLTAKLGKLNVANNNNNSPQPTRSSRDLYGLQWIDQASQTWPGFTFTDIKEKYKHILDTPARHYVPQLPVHPRSIIQCEQDFVEYFKEHFEKTVNHALDVTFGLPVFIAIADFISEVEGNPKSSRALIKALPYRMIAETLNDQFGWNIHMNVPDRKILNTIHDQITTHFKNRSRVSKDDDQLEALGILDRKHTDDDLWYLVALALRNVLSQHSIPERLHGNDLRPIVELLPLHVKVKQILPWIKDTSKADKFRSLVYCDSLGEEQIESLFKFLPVNIQRLANNDISSNGLDLIFARLPSPLERHKFYGGQGNPRLIRMVPISGVTLYERLEPDLASSVSQDPSHNVLPGEFKFSKTWEPHWETSTNSLQRDAFWHAISQVQCYTYQCQVRYGYVISDAGLRCFRRVAKKDRSGQDISKHGHVELSPIIRWNDNGQTLTVMFAVWYLHVIAAEEDCRLPNELWVKDTSDSTKMVFRGERQPIDNPTFTNVRYEHRQTGRPTLRPNRGGNNAWG